MMYSDDVPDIAESLGAALTIERASNIEWDNLLKGWVVRSAKDPCLAIRFGSGSSFVASRIGELVSFKSREEAVSEERRLFWDLLEK